MQTNRKETGEKLRDFRIAKGYSEKEFAEKIGISESRLKNFENGKSPIPITIFLKMCEVLKLTGEDVDSI